MSQLILCVEDDPHIGRILTDLLENAGFDVDWVKGGESALVRWQHASLVLLDLMLPGIDGIAVCRHIRAHDSTLPLIMLTARAATHEVVQGLEMGADDYITKPFESTILLARIASLLRRHGNSATEHAKIVVDNLTIDPLAQLASLDDKPLSLTAKEFALLMFFAQHPGQVFSRGELLDAIWGSEFDGFDHTVNTHINRLRNKLEYQPAQPRFIHTVWGVGYRFVEAPK